MSDFMSMKSVAVVDTYINSQLLGNINASDILNAFKRVTSKIKG